MPLTTAQINHIVQARWFVIDVNPRVTDTSNLGLSGFYGGGFVVSGEGAPQLQTLQQHFAGWPRVIMLIDLLTSNIAHFVPCSLADVEALRLAFVSKYGDTTPPQPAPPVESPP